MAWSSCLAALGEARAALDHDRAVSELQQAIEAAATGGWALVLAEGLCRRARVLGIALEAGASIRSRLRVDVARTRALLQRALE